MMCLFCSQSEKIKWQRRSREKASASDGVEKNEKNEKKRKTENVTNHKIGREWKRKREREKGGRNPNLSTNDELCMCRYVKCARCVAASLSSANKSHSLIVYNGSTHTRTHCFLFVCSSLLFFLFALSQFSVFFSILMSNGIFSFYIFFSLLYLMLSWFFYYVKWLDNFVVHSVGVSCLFFRIFFFLLFHTHTEYDWYNPVPIWV